MNSLLRLIGLDAFSRVDSVLSHQWGAARALPEWLLAVAIALALLASVVNFLPQLRMRLSVRLVTFLARLGMAGVLLAAALGVELRLQVMLRDRPQWLVMLDDSASMATADAPDGQTRHAAASQALNRIRSKASSEVLLDYCTLSGQAVGGEVGQGPTPLRRFLEQQTSSGKKLDRLILLTDGRDHEASDLSAVAQRLRARGTRASVALFGSPQPPAASSVFAEPERNVIRLGEALVINVSITAPNGPDRTIVLKEDGRSVKEYRLAADQARWSQIAYKPPRDGKHQYTVELLTSAPRVGNNAASFVAQIVNSNIRVLMIEGFPRYEYKLMKYALEIDPMVHLVAISHLPGGGVYVQGEPLHANPDAGLIASEADLFKYDVVILRDVPRSLFRAGGDLSESRLRLLVDFMTRRGGGLLVAGGRDVYRAGGYETSALAALLPFDLSDAISKAPQFPGMFFVHVAGGLYEHPILRLLSDSGANRQRWEELRELDGSNNVGRLRPLATSLLTRTVELTNARGETERKQVPILACQAVGEGKVVAAAVDTLWRWQLQPEFDDPPLATLLANIVRYVAPDPRRSAERPNISIANASVQVGQQALLSTVLKNKNYEPVRNADLKVTVCRPDGAEQLFYPRDVPEQPGYYEYRVPVELPGLYEVTAQYAGTGQSLTFLAGAWAGEFTDLSVDRQSMEALAQATGGQIIENLDEWLGSALAGGSTRAASRTLKIWNSPLALGLFLALLCVDCYVRKRQGLA